MAELQPGPTNHGVPLAQAFCRMSGTQVCGVFDFCTPNTNVHIHGMSFVFIVCRASVRHTGVRFLETER